MVPASNTEIQDLVQHQLPPAAELQFIYLNDQMTADDQRLLEITPSASTTYAPTKNHVQNFTTVGPIVGMRMYRLATASPMSMSDTRNVMVRGGERFGMLPFWCRMVEEW
jgi:hypothetical protein